MTLGMLDDEQVLHAEGRHEPVARTDVGAFGVDQDRIAFDDVAGFVDLRFDGIVMFFTLSAYYLYLASVAVVVAVVFYATNFFLAQRFPGV